MCGGDDRGDVDRAGTPDWAASQIPLDDQGRHTRRPRPGPSGHNVRPRKGGWGGLLFVLVSLAMCGGGGGGGMVRPTEAEARKVIDRQRKSLRLWIDSDRRRNGGEQRFAVLLPLVILAMCGGGGRDDHDPDDPDNLGPRVRKLIRKEDVEPWKGDYGRWNFRALAHPFRFLGRVGAVS